MTTLSSCRFFYTPYFRSESVSESLPENVFFLSVGIENQAIAERYWASPLLPYTGRSAQRLLDDLLHYGLTLGAQSDMRAVAVQSAEALATFKRTQVERKEWSELELFTLADDDVSKNPLAELEDLSDSDIADSDILLHVDAGASAAKQSATEHDVEEQAASKEPVVLDEETLHQCREAAQKTLLLAWHLEEKAYELDSLRDAFSTGRSDFANTLGVEHDEDMNELFDMPELQQFSAELSGSGFDLLRPSWRVVLESTAHFLPEDGALFTYDASMVEEMQEYGVTFSAMPREQLPASITCPADECFLKEKNCLMATAPFWQIVGYREPPAERPWLYRSVILFACVEKKS